MIPLAESLTLVGAGRMGTALLAGWAQQGLCGRGTTVIEPAPSPALAAFCAGNGVTLNPQGPHAEAEILAVAVKPQTLDAAAPALAQLAGPHTLVLSILAGKTIADLAQRMPRAKAIVRAMPNTPASIGRGVSGLVASAAATSAQRAVAQQMMEAVGAAVWLADEGLMDAVTAVSGSGPAYVFHFVEALADAGRAAGLPDDVAMVLARGTVEGAGALLEREASQTPSRLREAVTSPGGTTAAALDVLMAEPGLSALMREAVAAAVARGRALSG